MDKRTDEQLIEVVERFVLRARRVLAHSLCSDEDGLTNLADGAWYAARKDGVESVSRRLPNEEVVESLAARVRPLLLQNDGVHYDTVLNALSVLMVRRGLPENAAWCKRTKKEWRSVDTKSGTPGYYMSLSTDGTDAAPAQITDVGLADSWFYGDLVHADREKIDAGKAFGIDQRFAAAAVRTAQVAILTRELLAFVEALAEDGVVQVDTKVLHEVPVKVESKDVTLTGLFSAPSGTPHPGAAGTPLGEG